ncbi:hypothetical protein NDN08_003458 [Rhodosorus marinus]|uniref:UDP-N-acetylglucosamine diphosphorylase n=1 Tax=Rhodosorus marinus TaxID=101924 RepID=A0AAV8UWJ3_9RHOD|nr:hypothetical protein NDN08_003458 [Rhodosorus marinus]
MAPDSVKGLTEGVSLGEFLKYGESLPAVDVTDEFRDALEKSNAFATILAAGKGSRFSSELPKVIYPCLGIPMAAHALSAAEGAGIPSVLVVGYGKEQVLSSLLPYAGKSCLVAEDQLRIGTGHAVYVVSQTVPKAYGGDVVVMYGDNPGIDSKTLRDLLSFHQSQKAFVGSRFAATILTGSRSAIKSKSTSGYGRIIRNPEGDVVDIVEKKQIDRMEYHAVWQSPSGVSLSKTELEDMDEFNSGIVVASANKYFRVLEQATAVQTSPEPHRKFEFYATDFVKIMRASGLAIGGFKVDAKDTWKLEGANTVDELVQVEDRMKAAMATEENT